MEDRVRVGDPAVPGGASSPVHGSLPAHTPIERENLGKLRWRCRRGMKELDMLLTRYVDQDYSSASPLQQEAFRQLLDSPDPTLHAYFLGRETPPEGGLSTLIQRITASAPNDRY